MSSHGKYFCQNCGAAITPEDKFCQNCGAGIESKKQGVIAPSAQSYNRSGPTQQYYPSRQTQPAYGGPVRPNVSPKSRLVALLLCWFFGLWGFHRFYVGKSGTGILYLFTLGLFGIGIFVDFLLIIFGEFTDSFGLAVKEW